jgi:CRP/FNR family cyclic AMP-dependent transcriptional regulator
MADFGEELGIESYYRSFSAGSTLYYAGAPADTLFLIRDGRVRLLRRARGVERTTGLFGPGDLVGEEALLPGAHRSATAEALEPVTALVIESDTFRALTRKRPEVGEGAMQQLVRRLRRAEEQLDNTLVPDPAIRVLTALLHAVEEAGESRLRLSPLELSTRTALDLDRVKAVVRQLEERGYLETGDQTITVADPRPLRELHARLSMKEDVRHRLECR